MSIPSVCILDCIIWYGYVEVEGTRSRFGGSLSLARQSAWRLGALGAQPNLSSRCDVPSVRLRMVFMLTVTACVQYVAVGSTYIGCQRIQRKYCGRG